jgi:ComF family protein
MDLTSYVKLICDALLTLVYPQACVICQRSVERRALGVACEDCWNSTRLFTADETSCWKCGAPFIGSEVLSNRTEVRCHRCDSFAFTAARACGIYEKALREVVLNLKRQPHVPEFVVDSLVNTASREPLNESTLIVPVPLHQHRLQMRGFNQASIIARALSTSLQLPINEVSLNRTSHTEKYRAGLDVKGRSDTVAQAFEAAYPRLIAGEKILLIDDVFTTGATAAACAKALIEAGADSVFVLTVARTGR